MNSNKPFDQQRIRRREVRNNARGVIRHFFSRSLGAQHGFALVVTLSLMILLTIIAVGLLGLSAISLRGSSQSSAQAEARANARMALMMAIGDLQVELGPDRRVNCQAGIDKDALPEHQNWLGVYDAWSAAEVDRPQSADRFRRYLVSGDREVLRLRDAPRTTLPGENIEVVGEGTLGKGTVNGRVNAGLVSFSKSAGKPTGQFAWWIADENAKAMVNAGKDIPSEVSEELLAQQAAQAAPGTGFALAKSLANVTGSGRGPWDLGDSLRSKTVSTGSLELIPGADGEIGKNFHDLTTRAAGVICDVRNGRLKRDLSLYLQEDFAPANRSRLRQPLYTVQNKASVNFTPDSTETSRWDKLDENTGITMEELWLYYNLHKEVSYKRPASNDPLAGTIPAGYPTLLAPNSRDDVIRDPYYVYKRRVYSQVKYILSLAAAPSATQAGKYDLRVSVDPVVILWNPNNIALEYQTGGFTTVGFSSLPYDCKFDITSSTGSTSVTVPFSTFFGGVNGVLAQVGRLRSIVLRPGESRVLSTASDKTGGNSITVDLDSGWDFTTGAIFNATTFPKNLAASDRVRVTLQPRIQDASDDYITYWFGSRSNNPALQSGTISLQHDMQVNDELPTVTSPQAYSMSNIATEKKIPLMLFSYYLRPERDTPTPSKAWIWNNPSIIYRWPADSSISSLLHRQFEMKVMGLDTWENPYVQITPENQAYWGGGVRADFGVPFFTLRSVPLTPPQSLAAFQHACANGFRRYWKDSPISTGGLGTFPKDAYSLDGFRYLAPMVSKAIGNSFASPLIRGSEVSGQLLAHLGAGNADTARNYNIADHAYLANAALWDSWFLSSLTPQTTEPYGSNRRNLQKVFDDFFPTQAATQPVPLPTVRMLPYRRSGDESALRQLVRNDKASADAYQKLASHLMIDGAFNVNSTSVEAWKVILGSLRDQDTARRDRNANKLELETPAAGETAVNSLLIANGPRSEPTGNHQEPSQWTGYRALNDQQIEELATSLVAEIRLRGPFLCLSDFINRRPGNDAELARQGALQAAIEKSKINGSLDNSGRTLGDIGGAPFSEAGRGSITAGMPGYISQADLLTPLGPMLQARSDCFTIRAYGNAKDANGKILARAWCEATVQRVNSYIDPADTPDVENAALTSPVNRNFGRQFLITGFRWLGQDEI